MALQLAQVRHLIASKLSINKNAVISRVVPLTLDVPRGIVCWCGSHSPWLRPLTKQTPVNNNRHDACTFKGLLYDNTTC